MRAVLEMFAGAAFGREGFARNGFRKPRTRNRAHVAPWKETITKGGGESKRVL